MSILLEAVDLEAGYTRPVVGPLSFTVSEGEVVGSGVQTGPANHVAQCHRQRCAGSGRAA